MNLNHFGSFDIDWKILQVRTQSAGPGRGITKAKLKGKEHGGFKLVEGSLSIKEMLENTSYSDLTEGIKLRLVKIVKAYLDAGIITENDLTLNKEKKQKEKETEEKEPKEDSVPTES